jgi:hypothetical protein
MVHKYRLTWVRTAHSLSPLKFVVGKFEFKANSERLMEAVVRRHIDSLPNPEECSNFNLVEVVVEEQVSSVDLSFLRTASPKR